MKASTRSLKKCAKQTLWKNHQLNSNCSTWAQAWPHRLLRSSLDVTSVGLIGKATDPCTPLSSPKRCLSITPCSSHRHQALRRTACVPISRPQQGGARSKVGAQRSPLHCPGSRHALWLDHSSKLTAKSFHFVGSHLNVVERQFNSLIRHKTDIFVTVRLVKHQYNRLNIG